MLENVRENITKLIALYEGERQRSSELSLQVASLGKELESYRQQVKELNRKIDNLKLSGAFSAGSANEASKERLEKLIREIDKCISLLEK